MGGSIPYQTAMIFYAVFTYKISWDKIDCDQPQYKQPVIDEFGKYLIDTIDWDVAYNDVLYMWIGHGVYITMYFIKKIFLTKKTDCQFYL